MAKQFVHLHAHTDYSLLDGACGVEDLVALAVEQGSPAVAVTDHGNLFGAVKFYNAAKQVGINPIIGCEVYVAQGSRTSRDEKSRYNHLVLLCETTEGYRNLSKLVSSGYLEGFYRKPRIDKDILAQHSKGLICLSACLRGEINEALLAEKPDDAKRLAYQYSDLFGKGNYYLEIQDQGLPQEKIINPMIVRLSQETGLPLVATNDAHYLQRDDARAQDALLCIQTGRTLKDESRLKFSTQEFYVKSYDEMHALFGEIPDVLGRTLEIAERCHCDLEKVAKPFPRFDVPEGYTLDSYFDHVAREGFAKRRIKLEAMAARGQLAHPLADYEQRLSREIAMIQQMKFPGYFLIVWDFIQFAKKRGIPVGPGRGSAAGSAVSWALEITDIDPLRYELIFERFLNPERISMPDIDIDFCMNRRGEVIDYVTQKYGRENVAQIITFGTLGAKAAIKDVGRVMDVPYADMDKIAKLVPTVLNISIEEARAQAPLLQQAIEKDERLKQVFEVAERLEGFVRNASVHAAGVVIAPQPLRELVPLYKTNRDEITTQYDMKDLEKLGLLKMDFLGLTTLTSVTDCLDLIRVHRGEILAVDEIPLDDEKTYELFSQARTMGVFQFESGGMCDVLRRARPSRLEDLTALNALFRPGPMKDIDDFIARKHGLKPVTYEFAELEPILRETYGIVVYQEQVMQIAHHLAGFSLGEADLLRRAMGKKDKVQMGAQKEKFVKGCVERGHNKAKVAELFEVLEPFAGYAFNKSHSAAYAYLAYVTGYLKTHYRAEFMAAVLTCEAGLGNTDKVVRYINEAREMGLTVLPPDINLSGLNFTPEGQDLIRFGLRAVKNVGENAILAILEARQEVTRFNSIYQFCEKTDLRAMNKRVVESLIKAGALDSLNPAKGQTCRAALTAAVDKAFESGTKAQRDRQSGQGGLFGMLMQPEAGGESEPLPNVAEWSEADRLAGEKETIGFYLSGHPLGVYLEKMHAICSADSSTLENLAQGDEVTLGGLISSVRAVRSRKGDMWAQVRLEDLNGFVELLVFPEAYKRIADRLQPDAAVFVRGRVNPDESGPPKVNVTDLVPLDTVSPPPLPDNLLVRVRLGRNGGDTAAKLADLFQRKPGAAKVRFELVEETGRRVNLDPPTTVRPDREFLESIEKICGKGCYQLI
jgi:DNA polymerase-3 subunit alpha